MSLDVGIVGLPNVGKSTLFKSITSVQADASNYPFCTIEPNVGLVEVPDQRMDRLQELFKPEKLIRGVLRMVDIAGLVEGASKGEGLGNKFLDNIRQTDAIAHIVRCFHDDNIVHVRGKVNPAADIAVINSELLLADLEQTEKRLEKMRKMSKGNKEVAKSVAHLELLANRLQDGKLASSFEVEDDFRPVFQELNLITAKPFFFVMNVAESELSKDTPEQQTVREIAKELGVNCLKICCSIEAELAELEAAEKQEMLTGLGISETGLSGIVRTGFSLLDQVHFFTAGKKEVRAWNVRRGSRNPQAAGKIHSDMERGFIRAEIYNFEDIDKLHTEAAVKEAGKLRVEGKDYVIQDGDIIHVRFNV